MRGRLSIVLAFVVGFAAIAPAHVDSQARAGSDEAPARRDATREPGRRRANSISVGLPFRGRLRRGVELTESRWVRRAGEYRATGNFFGTTELVNLLERSAAHVARRFPGARLSVGELSAEHGGPIAGHRSHQNGRDADIAFYMRDAAGRPFEPFAFAAFDRLGHGIAPNESLSFDDDRNWELVARLVTDADARVQFIFVADTLKQRLLRTARRRRARADVVARAEAVMVQPTHGHPHRNHFHVRVYCPPGDRPACEDREPFHPWYPGTPPARAAEPAGPAAPDVPPSE